MISSPHRPTVVRVDLEAIKANLESVKESLKPGVKTFAVVKANAYGHGATEVSRHIESLVDAFCVSNLDEALELRQAGISCPILVLGVVMPEAVALAIEYDITLTVTSLDWLAFALKQEVSLADLTVHLKVDSGMGRLGFRSSRDVNQALRLLGESGARVEGIFTHFATADEAETTHFEKQLATFKDLLENLDWVPEIVHASNSATTLWHRDAIFNAVREGIVLYGLNPSGTVLSEPFPLQAALTLESSLIHVKKIGQGDSVGYGATYQAFGEEWVGTVPIGYADGWTRDTQGFHVLVEGEPCEIIGRISMDQLTIRLPRAYPLGTPVTLIGVSGEESISVTDVASYRGTINYEVVCLLSDRIPRVYH